MARAASPVAFVPLSVSVLRAPPGLHATVIARIPSGARELAFAPNGDLFVGTNGDGIYVVPHADGAGAAGSGRQFARLADEPAAGLTFGAGALYVGTQFSIYRIPYRIGDRSARSEREIAQVRASGDHGDDNHRTTSLAFTRGVLYASIGSTCDACRESNPLRATIQQMKPDGTRMRAKAVRFRNAIALAANPATVPMKGDAPAIVDWNNPTTQWRPFVTGFQPGCSSSTRIGRPTGIAVGPQGDLFVGDDQTGYIYRIRP